MASWNTGYPRNTGRQRYVNELGSGSGSDNIGQFSGTLLTSPGVASSLNFVLPNGFNAWNLRLSWQDTVGNGAAWTWSGGTRFLNGLIAAPASGANGFAIGTNFGSSMTADPLPDDTIGQALTVSFTQNVNAATVSYTLDFLNSSGRVA